MNPEYREALADAAAHYRSELTYEQTRALACARADLYNGPDPDAEYGFTRACEILRAWAESVEDVRETVDVDLGPNSDGNPCEYESLVTVVEARAIVRAIVGAELAPYL